MMSIIGEAATAKVNLPEPDSGTSYVQEVLDENKNVIYIKVYRPTNVQSLISNFANSCTTLKGCSLVRVTRIYSSAFKGCTSLESLVLPDEITRIDSSAFEGCTSLALTSLPSGLTYIDSSAFSDCTSLALTSLPSGLSTIRSSAFYGCTSLKISSLPNGLSSLAASTFRNCTQITSMDIPASVTTINSYVFYGCTQLKVVTLRATTMLTWKTSFLPAASQMEHIYVPSGLVDSYKAATGWSRYAAKISAIT